MRPALPALAPALLALAACSADEPASDVDVELAGVTLADDCADGSRTKPIPPPHEVRTAARDRAQAPPVAMERPAAAAAACSAGVECGGPPQPPCEQTSMQLAIRSRGAARKVAIERVELLDATGTVLGQLAARAPSTWAGDRYVAWDEAVPANASVSVSYKLASPDWQKVAGGRWEAHARRFQLRVTVRIDGAQRTLIKQSITPAMLEPAVAT